MNAVEVQVTEWLREDDVRWRALSAAAELNLNDWCLAAGFVRNLVWDKLHGYTVATPLDDLDLIYFDSKNTAASSDRKLETELTRKCNLPWSVKNQARMHKRNGHKPYVSTRGAMSYWAELETAVGVRLESDGAMTLIAPFGLDALMAGTLTPNPAINESNFLERLARKRWLEKWPNLTLSRVAVASPTNA